MTDIVESKIKNSEITNAELISHFREKCKICGHHRIMHNDLGACEGVNFPAQTSIISKWVPYKERSRAWSWAMAGESLGTVDFRRSHYISNIHIIYSI